MLAPRITIIVPVYNGELLLRTCLDSIVSQHYANLELIVMDAGSTDGTLDIVKSYGDQVALCISEPDKGAADASNKGIQRATGDIIGLLNCDDWYEPGILQEVGEAFAADPELDMAACETRIVSRAADGTLVTGKYFRGPALGVSGRASSVINARFIRKRVYERYGLFEIVNQDGTHFFGNDMEFILRLSFKPVKNHVINRLGHNYLAHEGSFNMSGDIAAQKRFHRELGYIARRFLFSNLPLTRYHKRRLHRWFRRDSAARFAEAWRAGNTKEAWKMVRDGMRISPFSWAFYMLKRMAQGRI